MNDQVDEGVGVSEAQNSNIIARQKNANQERSKNDKRLSKSKSVRATPKELQSNEVLRQVNELNSMAIESPVNVHRRKRYSPRHEERKLGNLSGRRTRSHQFDLSSPQTQSMPPGLNEQ